MAASMFESLRNHPNVTPLLLAQAPTGPNAMALREFALQMLLNAGFSPSVAVRSYATLARFVLGFALQLTGEQAGDVAIAGALDSSGQNRLPDTATVAEIPPLDDQFAFGLNLLLTGIAHRRSSPAGPPPVICQPHPLLDSDRPAAGSLNRPSRLGAAGD
jgi:hypothetical protein